MLREIVAFGCLACGSLMAVAYFVRQPLNTQVSPAAVHLQQRTKPIEVIDAREFTPAPPVQLSTPAELGPSIVSGQPEMLQGVQSSKDPWPDSELALTIEIQEHLIRLGCYSGSPDGKWSKRVRTAMEQLNSRLNAVIPTETPDHALLALARGQSVRVCGSKRIAGQATVETGVLRSTDVSLADDSDGSGEQFDTSYRMSLGAAPANNSSSTASGRTASKKVRKAHKKTLSHVQERFLHPLGRQLP
jgi:hypothetical protein